MMQKEILIYGTETRTREEVRSIKHMSQKFGGSSLGVMLLGRAIMGKSVSNTSLGTGILPWVYLHLVPGITLKSHFDSEQNR